MLGTLNFSYLCQSSTIQESQKVSPEKIGFATTYAYIHYNTETILHGCKTFYCLPLLKLYTFLLHPAPHSIIPYTRLNCRRTPLPICASITHQWSQNQQAIFKVSVHSYIALICTSNDDKLLLKNCYCIERMGNVRTCMYWISVTVASASP